MPARTCGARTCGGWRWFVPLLSACSPSSTCSLSMVWLQRESTTIGRWELWKNIHISITRNTGNLKGLWIFGPPNVSYIEINSVQEGPYSMASMGNTTATGALRGCSHITSAKNRGSYTPSPPSVSNGQHLAAPPSPLRQQWSAFSLPPLPPSSAFVSIFPPALLYYNFDVDILTW